MTWVDCGDTFWHFNALTFSFPPTSAVKGRWRIRFIPAIANYLPIKLHAKWAWTVILFLIKWLVWICITYILCYVSRGQVSSAPEYWNSSAPPPVPINNDCSLIQWNTMLIDFTSYLGWINITRWMNIKSLRPCSCLLDTNNWLCLISTMQRFQVSSLNRQKIVRVQGRLMSHGKSDVHSPPQNISHLFLKFMLKKWSYFATVFYF